MNRGFIVVAIVLGVAATGGGAAYYLTDRYGSADHLITETGIIPAVFAPSDAGAGQPGYIPPPPPGAPPPSSSSEAGSAEVDIAQTLGAFDHTNQSLVWVLPPGVHAEGPFKASVTVSHNGQTRHESEFPLAATRLDAGARSEFPAGSDVVQLAANDSWPTQRDEIVAVVNQLKAAHGPGGGELDIRSDFKARIDESHRRTYCIEGQDLPIDLFLASGDPSGGASAQLTRLDLGDGQMILRRTILMGGCKAS